MRMHFVSKTCAGELCAVCLMPATHKLGEEIPHDDPEPIRHNLTAYVCCRHFALIVGGSATCPPENFTDPDGPRMYE